MALITSSKQHGFDYFLVYTGGCYAKVEGKISFQMHDVIVGVENGIPEMIKNRFGSINLSIPTFMVEGWLELYRNESNADFFRSITI